MGDSESNEIEPKPKENGNIWINILVSVIGVLLLVCVIQSATIIFLSLSWPNCSLPSVEVSPESNYSQPEIASAPTLQFGVAYDISTIMYVDFKQDMKIPIYGGEIMCNSSQFIYTIRTGDPWQPQTIKWQMYGQLITYGESSILTLYPERIMLSEKDTITFRMFNYHIYAEISVYTVTVSDHGTIIHLSNGTI